MELKSFGLKKSKATHCKAMLLRGKLRFQREMVLRRTYGNEKTVQQQQNIGKGRLTGKQHFLKS